MNDKNISNKIRIQQALANKSNRPASLNINPQTNKLFKKQIVKQKIVRGTNNNIVKKHPYQTIRMSLENIPQSFPSYQEISVPDWFISKHQKIDISIIIPCYKSKNYIAKQIENWNFDDHDGLKKEIIYVNDACPEKSATQIIRSWEAKKPPINGIGKIIDIQRRNGGFAFACNTGAKFARGKYLIFLNADTITTKDWIKPMYDCFQNLENVGIVGNLHLKDQNQIDSLGSEWDKGICAFLHIGKHIYNKKYINKPFTLENVPKELMTIRDVEMTTGACFMIEHEMFDFVRQFDVNYKIGYWEDADLCMKIKRFGSRVLFTPHSKIYHKGGHSNSASHEFVKINRNLFHRKWIKGNKFEELLAKKNLKKISINPKDIVVYTAISNGYDNLKEQPQYDGNAEYVAFLDKHEIENKFWKFKKIHNEFSDPNRNAKSHKILPHRYFPDKKYSLWIDGSIKIQSPFSINRIAEIYLADADLALFEHHERNCIYKEAEVCMHRKLDDSKIIMKQINKYRSEGYPSNYGLGECTVLLRRHTPEIIKFNEMWWKEICEGSRRDQLSFNYVLKKCGIKINYFPGDIKWDNYLFQRHQHAKFK